VLSTTPLALGVAAMVEVTKGADWAQAKLAASSNNSPVFFMLSPTPRRTKLALGFFRLSLWEDKGYSQKVARGKGRVKVTRVLETGTPKVFRRYS
jgi:hypothetical protein